MKTGILCDVEGRIIHISEEYKKLLQYQVNNNGYNKRIFAFIDKHAILTFIRQWQLLLVKTPLTLTTTFRKEDNQVFPAKITITPVANENYLLQIKENYHATPLLSGNVTLINKIQIWLLITRAKFLLATFIPLLFAITWSMQLLALAKLPIDLVIATIIGTISCHIAANSFNDYFDWLNEADQINNDFIMSISGGSRAMEFGLITPQTLFKVAIFSLFIAASCAGYISLIRGPLILLLSITGAFAAYFYTAPPIRLVARYGLGELFIFLCFGPLFIAGVILVLTNNISWQNFMLGVPIGLLITSILLINGYPDLTADARAKKYNLAVILGKKFIPWGMLLLIGMCYVSTIYLVLNKLLAKCYLLTLITMPLAIYEIILVFNIEKQRKIMHKACINNLKLYASFGIMLIISNIICC